MSEGGNGETNVVQYSKTSFQSDCISTSCTKEATFQFSVKFIIKIKKIRLKLWVKKICECVNLFFSFSMSEALKILMGKLMLNLFFMMMYYESKFMPQQDSINRSIINESISLIPTQDYLKIDSKLF